MAQAFLNLKSSMEFAGFKTAFFKANKTLAELECH